MRQLLMIGLMATMSAAALASDTAPTSMPAAKPGASDEIVCRKTLETGSLVRKTKQCFTRAEWDRIQAANRAGNQKVADQLSGGFNCQATGTC